MKAGAGAGSRPLNVGGKVYLAGPYHGAPLSLVVVVPAVSGPYDLGNIAVRAAINVDPVTAQVATVSDPLPQIIEGIQLRARSLRVDIDRPTSRSTRPTATRSRSTPSRRRLEGGTAILSKHFQVANCAAMGFKPKPEADPHRRPEAARPPGDQGRAETRPGESNLRRTAVALPKGELLDNSHIGTICTRPQFAADACPAGSLLGTAEAVTPILDRPLRGNVYLRSSNHNLPDLVADLEGQIDVELAGKIDTINGGSLRTTFESVPDAPVTEFRLKLAGGKKGLLVNSESLCKGRKFAVDQDGRTEQRQAEDEDEAEDEVRLEEGSPRSSQASSPCTSNEEGGLGNGDLEEKDRDDAQQDHTFLRRPHCGRGSGLVAALPASAIEIRPNTYNFGYNGEKTEPIVGPFFSGPISTSTRRTSSTRSAPAEGNPPGSTASIRHRRSRRWPGSNRRPPPPLGNPRASGRPQAANRATATSTSPRPARTKSTPTMRRAP